MTAPKLTDRQIAEIRRRYWAEKARQEREDMARYEALANGTWYTTPVAGNPVGTY
jgi:hypothetical protein